MKQVKQAIEVQRVAEMGARVRESVGRVVVGKGEVVELVLVGLLCEGHLLLEDVPGIGKTTLAKAVARSLDCTFSRIQFTPDLLPSDVTGVSIYNQKTQQFEYRPGPINAQIILADEINRATPRTQAALLEAMEERQATVDGVTRPLPRPFLVMGTQNPIELEGTFPLPEAQVDRFLLRLDLGYPSETEEEAILLRFQHANPLDTIEAVAGPAELGEMQRRVREVTVNEAVRRYVLRIVRQTRHHEALQLGASPRGSLALFRGAQALAALGGRDYVLPDDVKRLAPYALSHRLILHPQARLRGRETGGVLSDILEEVPVPVED